MRILLITIGLLWLSTGIDAQRPARIGELQQLSPATFRLAFHFVAGRDGNNFTPTDSLPGGNELLRAEVFIGYLLREMNKRFAGAVLNAPSTDTRIRFVPVNGEEQLLASSYFYAHDERVKFLPDAMNIVFTDYRGRRGKAPSGSTNGAGSNRVSIYGLLPRFLSGNNDWWNVARNILHEIGHTQGLNHTFHCDNPCDGIDLVVRDECYGKCATNNAGSVGSTNCYGSSKRELIMGYGSQVYLTACETEQLWKYLLAHPQPWVDMPLVVGAAPW